MRRNNTHKTRNKSIDLIFVAITDRFKGHPIFSIRQSDKQISFNQKHLTVTFEVSQDCQFLFLKKEKQRQQR